MIDQELQNIADEITNETRIGANTAQKIGALFNSLIEKILPVDDISQQPGTSTTKVMSQAAIRTFVYAIRDAILKGSGFNLDSLQFNPATETLLTNIGQLRWNATNQTLEIKCSNDVTLSIGHENYIRGKNAETTQILNGKVVYVSGGLGANALIKRASNNNTTGERVIGVATQNIGPNSIGFVTTNGIVNEINTSAFAEGDVLWLGVDGALTNVKPGTDVNQICIGVVLRSHATQGSLLVSVKDDWRDQVAQLRSDLSEIEINKLDKSSLSNLLDLDSENNAATSRAVKFLNDKVEQVKDGGLEDGSIELPKLSPTLAAYIGSGGEVTNQADDEDLENAIINDVPVIREKTNKAYTPETYSGMGRVILRKNMVNGVNVLTQEMINQDNTIYEIRYDFILDEDITIPENCVLEFDGGSVSGNKKISGTFKTNGNGLNCFVNGEILSTLYFYGTIDAAKNASILKSARGGIYLLNDIISDGFELRTCIDGLGHSIIFSGKIDGNTFDFILVKKNNISIINTKLIKAALFDRTIDSSNYLIVGVNRRIVMVRDYNNFILSNCYMEGSVDFETSYAKYETSEECTGLLIENCYFNIDWTKINNMNALNDEHHEFDILEVRGGRNIKLSNNKIRFKNVNRVFKFTSANFSKYQDYKRGENEAGIILIENNDIKGFNLLDETYWHGNIKYWGKQIMDFFSGAVQIYINNNKFDISGHTTIFENKSAILNENDTDYTSRICITNNRIKTDGTGIIRLVERGDNTFFDFCNNDCEITGNISTYIGTTTYPICISNIRVVNIKENNFYGIVTVYICFRVLEQGSSGVTGYIETANIEKNIYSTNNYASLVFFHKDDNTIEINNLNLIDNICKTDGRILGQMTGASCTIKNFVFKDNNVRTASSYYLISIVGIIENMYISIKYPYYSTRVLLNQGTISKIFNEYGILSGGIQVYLKDNKGNTAAMNALTPKHLCEFYNTEDNKIYWWNGTAWVDATGATV